MIVCTECGSENDDERTQCSNCGAELPAHTVPSAAAITATLVASRPGDHDTTVSGGAAQTRLVEKAGDFAPLPAGALLAGVAGEYEVQQLKKEEGALRHYQAISVGESHACSKCGYLHNPADEDRCLSCGSDISDASPAHLPVTVLESSRPESFGVLERLARLDVHSPNLRLPLDVFSRRVGGQERHFLVLPPPPAASLAGLQPPQELPDVLHWGICLAGGLAAIHQAQIGFGGFSAERAGLEGKQAGLADFSQAIYPAREPQFRQDIQQLAGALFYLLTGQSSYKERPGTPPQAAAAFQRALNGGFDSASAFQRALEQALESVRRPPSVDYLVGRRTDVGRSRKLNEDSLLALHMVWNNKGVNYPLGVFAVADGMGGHSAGEVASGLALQAVAQSALEYLLAPDADENLAVSHAQWVEQAVAAANRAVHEQVEASKSDMGTTLVLSLLVGDQLFLANVGDSRAYLIDGQGIRQLTEDHSLVERLVASGQISRADARMHPQRNVIYRTIGDRGEVEVDSWRLTVKAGDRILLCSDGLCTMVDDKLIYRLVTEARMPQPACDALIKAANEAGGTDNITAVVVQILALT